MRARKLGADFDSGKNVKSELDLSRTRRPLQDQKRVKVDFPTWIIGSLDREAGRLGVTRQSIIKMWLAEHRDQRAMVQYHAVIRIEKARHPAAATRRIHAMAIG